MKEIKIPVELRYKPERLIKYENRGKMFLAADGGRSIGKSYGIIRDVGMKRFLNTGEEFIYLRRYMNDYTQMGNFFARYTEEYEPPEICNDWSVIQDNMSGGFFQYKGKTAGYYSSLSKLLKKGAEFPNVQAIIFDEYICQPGQRYIKDEFDAFLAVVDSICRYVRPVKVYMMANDVSMFNPYHLNFGYKYSGEEFWAEKSKDGTGLADATVIQHCKEIPGLTAALSSTPFGRAIQGTKYGGHALYNESLTSNQDFIKQKTRYSRLAFVVRIEGKDFGFWIDKTTSPAIFTVSENTGDNKCEHFVVDPMEREFDYKTLNELRQLPFWFAATISYDKGFMFYESDVCQGAVLELMRKGWSY